MGRRFGSGAGGDDALSVGCPEAAVGGGGAPTQQVGRRVCLGVIIVVAWLAGVSLPPASGARWAGHRTCARLAVPAAAAARRKPLNRRFIVVEGIYANYGDVAPLDAIRELKEVRCWLGGGQLGLGRSTKPRGAVGEGGKLLRGGT